MIKKETVKDSDIENYLKTHTISASSTRELQHDDLVSYNGKYYILKIKYKIEDSDSIFGKEYSLYNLDGTLYKENVDKKDIKFVMDKKIYEEMVKEIQSGTTTTAPVSTGGGGGGGYYGGGTSLSRSGKSYSTAQSTDTTQAVQNAENTQNLSDKLGSTTRTKRTLESCQETIAKAQNAINTANITVNKWEDTKNAQGYATDASIVYLNNLTKALDTLEKNLDKTQVSALEVNALNIATKDLLVEFTEKKEKEDELKPKEESLASMSPTIETTDSDGKKTSKTNEAYTKLKGEIDTLKSEIAEIDTKITELQNEVDARFTKIKEKYGGLLNFSGSNITIPGNNIFGTSGNTNGKSLEVDGEVIKNYMLSNNLEYFEYENSIYNIPSPYDPWNKEVINMDEKYLLRYDLNKLQQLSQNGNQIATGAIEFLKGKASGQIPASVRYYVDTCEAYTFMVYENGQYKSISKNYRDQIVQVMDNVLNDSYVSNGCQSVTDYATTSMMVMSGGIFNPCYSGDTRPTTKGCGGVINGADCIGAVNWAMCQGIMNAEDNNNVKPLGLGYGLRPRSNGYDGTSVCDVGTIFTKQIPGNWHTGMVVGHTTINGVTYNVIVQSGNRQYGFNAHIVKNNSYDTAVLPEQIKNEYYA